jgi:hypothetical protein
MNTDSNDQPYVELPLPNGFLRVTFIEVGWTDTPCFRVQTRDETGHLRLGPEIPVSLIDDLREAVRSLTSR